MGVRVKIAPDGQGSAALVPCVVKQVPVAHSNR